MNNNIVRLDWDDIANAVDALANRLDAKGFKEIYGIPTGGAVVAAMLRGRGFILVNAPDTCRIGTIAVVDDLVDSSQTIRSWKEQGYYCDALYRKPYTPRDIAPDAWDLGNVWIAFPWEHEPEPCDAVVRLLQMVGEDPNREGLLDTPRRVVHAWQDMTIGYRQDPSEFLSKQFTAEYDEMVIETGIEFESLCEHHILPFVGEVAIGYIPDGRVVGASKLVRLVDCYAKRLQIQERLTTQIAKAIEEHVPTKGVGVVVVAHHECMGCRGVRRRRTVMKTSCLLGVLRSDPSARAEFLTLIGK